MDGTTRRWRCGNGHVLGVVQRVKVEKRWVERLMLFRQAIDLSGHMDDVDVIACIEGTTLDVRCSVCGAVRSWFIGEAAMEALLERVRQKWLWKGKAAAELEVPDVG